MQTAADSAAIAAGLENGNCSETVCSNLETAAEPSLTEDGITSTTITPTVNQLTVPASTGLAMITNAGPCVLGSSDPNCGNALLAEAMLTEPQRTLFGSLAGIPTFNPVARAEAGTANYLNSGGGNCIWASSINLNGYVTISLNQCGFTTMEALEPAPTTM